MPDRCEMCHLYEEIKNGDPDWCKALHKALPEYSDCPLIPVPDHGRLIDADEVDRRYTPDFTELSDFQCGWNAAMKRVCDDAPTIIPASGGKENE